MKKSTKILTTMMSVALVAPTMSFATNNIENNTNININLEKRSVVLGDKSKVNILLKENQNAKTITLNLLCYDMPLSTTLYYNEVNNTYEGEIEFNKDPEYLNVWEIENITINSENNPAVLNKEDLQNLGLNLDDYKITQEYLFDYNNPESIAKYIQKSSIPVKKMMGAEREDTAVEISKEGWKNGSKKVIIVSGYVMADGLTATPLATTYDSPILLCKTDYLPQATIDEINRLNPEEIIVVGGDRTVSNKVISDLNNSTKKPVKRIAGADRYETSLKIAQEIDNNHDVNKMYIVNGYKGEAEVMSIAPKAGMDKQPIILTEETKLPQSTYDWLKNENLKDAYFIGGEKEITTDVIHQVADITTPETGQSVYKNRVNGSDSHEINAAVMKKFYPQNDLDSVMVTKSNVLVDALTAGPLAAKLNAPIMINPTDYISAYHEDNLKEKTAKTLYEVGGGMSESVINDIAYKLSDRNSGDKTVVIDPGHGGSDSGAVNPKDKSQQEKNYTLDTSLSAASYLRDKNINVVLTRESDKTLDLSQRSGISNSIGPDLFASIHYNASNTQGNGVEVYYKNKDRNGGTSKTLANNILNNILNQFSLKNRGIKTRTLDDGRDYYSVIRNTNAPSVIVECSFIDNENDQKFVNTLDKRKLMGTQIGKGIEQTIK